MHSDDSTRPQAFDLLAGLGLLTRLPVPVDGTRIPSGPEVRLTSDSEPEPAVVPLDVDDPASILPAWGRYVAGVVHELRPTVGFQGSVRSSVPKGSGLSSSAALEVAVALALGAGEDRSALELAQLCQRAEHVSSGVPSGIMDQLASAAGVAGHALLIDCHTLEIRPTPVPDGLDVVVVHSGQPRTLSGSAYAERVAECARAEADIGPLRLASVHDVDGVTDEVARRRARHVVTENERVRAFTAALAVGDLRAAGAAMLASHASLRDDYEVSTPVLDEMVERLVSTPGVHGARLTGAGFGGCVVALADAGAVQEGWVVHPVAGASVEVLG
jgi:galactokinase